MMHFDGRRDRAADLRQRTMLAALAALAVAYFVSGEAEGARSVTPVALQGQIAPGTGGQTFATDFDEPMVNTSGDVVFQASYGVAGSADGVFLFSGGALSAVAVAGLVVPGVGTLSGNFYDGPSFNNSSTVTLVASGITASSNIPPTTDAVLQKTLAGSLTAIAKNGDAVPGVAGGVFTDFDDIAQNANNDVSFIGHYTDDGGTTFKWGVFFKPFGGALQTIVKDGDALPNTGGGTFCSGSTPDGPWLNDSGVVSFIADCISGGTVSAGSMFAKRPAQALESVVLTGDPAPPSVGGTLDSSSSAGRPGLTNGNQMGMNVETSAAGPCGAQQCAMLLVTLGSPASAASVCALGGSVAPGTVGTFGGFGGPAINQSGTMVTQADVIGDPNVTNGIFTCHNGTSTAISLEGDPKPGGAIGELFTNDQSDPSISDDGRVAFVDFGTTAGAFVSGANQIAPLTAIPTLNNAVLLVMLISLLGLGLIALRYR